MAYNNWRPTSLTSDLGEVAAKTSKELRSEIQCAILHGGILNTQDANAQRILNGL